MEQIQIIDYPRFEQDIEIDGRLHKIGFDYSYTTSLWSMSIEDRETGQAVSGITLVPGFPLLYQYREKFNFAGDIYAMPANAKGNEAVDAGTIGYDTLVHGHVAVYYASFDEIRQAEASI